LLLKGSVVPRVLERRGDSLNLSGAGAADGFLHLEEQFKNSFLWIDSQRIVTKTLTTKE
jgi:hypothetical protein